MSAIHDKHISSSGSSMSHVLPSLNNTNSPNLNAMTHDKRRRAALRKVDEAAFSWFHVKACLVAGVGFFTVAYDIFAIDIAVTMIGFVYGTFHDGDANKELDKNLALGLKVATPVGTLLGQLLFGWLADMVGRKKMYGVELMIMLVGTFAQALSGNGPSINIIGILIVWRFIMGIGIGGDYPLSAVITSEFAATRIRGRMMTAVFSMQGFGTFTAALVALILTEAYKSKIITESSSVAAIDNCWRLFIGLGAVPGVLALYLRLTIPESPRYTMDVERNVRQAAQDVDTFLTTGTYNIDPDAIVERVSAPKASWEDFRRHFGKWKNGKVLFGTAYSWFALDIAFYGLGLNSSTVLTTIAIVPMREGDTSQILAYNILKNVSTGNLILSACGLIPGFLAAFLFIDRWGRKPIQLMGFGMLTVIFVCMGFGYNAMVNLGSGAASRAFVFLYCLANFFQNFGPNTTTFVVPGEAFPTRYRSTAHGISAASGKLGAIIAQVAFAHLKDIGGENAFIQHILEIFGFFMLTGLLATFLINETMDRSLEELSNESQDDFISGGAGPLELYENPGMAPRTQIPISVTQPIEQGDASLLQPYESMVMGHRTQVPVGVVQPDLGAQRPSELL